MNDWVIKSVWLINLNESNPTCEKNEKNALNDLEYFFQTLDESKFLQDNQSQ